MLCGFYLPLPSSSLVQEWNRQTGELWAGARQSLGSDPTLVQSARLPPVGSFAWPAPHITRDGINDIGRS